MINDERREMKEKNTTFVHSKSERFADISGFKSMFQTDTQTKALLTVIQTLDYSLGNAFFFREN